MRDIQSEDEMLMQQIAAGSEKAFNQFYESHISFVFQIAINILHDQVEAEDICHDIFIDVYQNPRAYNKNKGSIKAWLAIKTRSRCIDKLRKKKPILINKLESLVTEQDVKAELHVLKQIENDILLEALKHIPEKQREVIYGMYFERKTQQELAISLNRPIGTIKSLVRYGLNNLRKQKVLLDWKKSSWE